MAKKNNNLNLTFSGLFLAFSLAFFLLWWFRGVMTLPPAIIMLVIGIILLFVNFNAGKDKKAKTPSKKR